MSEANSTPILPGSKTQAIGEWLDSYLRRSARLMKTIDLSMLILYGLVTFVLFLIAVIILDHWIWPLNQLARFSAWLLIVGASTWWILTRILPASLRSVQPAYAAKQIESTIPELKNSLINWFELSAEKDSTPRGVLAVIGRHAMGHLRIHEASSVVDQAGPIRWMACLMGLIVVLGIYLALAPKSGIDTVRRVLFPWASIATPSRVQILGVEPGNTSATQGSLVPIRVQLRGLRQGEPVSLEYETSDGQLVNQIERFESEIEGLSYQLDFGKKLGGVQQPMRYRVRAGDAVSDLYRIDVHAVPLVVIDRIEYEYPSYMLLKSRSIQSDGRIEAPEGTLVKVFGTSNQSISKSRIEFDPEVVDGKFIRATSVRDLQVDDRQVSGQWLLRLNEQRANPTLSTYRIKITNTLGESNSEPVIHPIKILADLTPEVLFLNEHANPWVVPVNESVGLEIRALDPDFGLAQLNLRCTSNGRVLLDEKLLSKQAEAPLAITKTFQFQPSSLGLKIGDSVQMIAEARDNRQKPGTEEWEPNVAQTKPITIEIGPPKKLPPSSEPKEGKEQETKNPKSQDLNKTIKQNDKQKGGTSNKAEQEKTDKGGSSQKENGQGISASGEGNDNNKGKEQGSSSAGGSSKGSSQEPSKNQDGTSSGSDPSNESSDANQDNSATGSNASRGSDKNATSQGPKDDGSIFEEIERHRQSQEGQKGNDSNGTDGNKQEGQKSGQQSGEKGSQQSGDKSGEQGSQKSGEQAGQKSNDPSGQKGNDTNGVNGNKQEGEKSGQQSGEKGSQQNGAKSGEQRSQKSGEQAGQKSNDPSGQKGNDKNGTNGNKQEGEKSGQQSGEKGSQQNGDKSGEQGSQSSGEQAGQKSNDPSGQKGNDKNGMNGNKQEGEKSGQQSGEKGSQQNGDKSGEQGSQKSGEQAGQKSNDPSGQKGNDKNGTNGNKQEGEKSGQQSGEKGSQQSGAKSGEQGGQRSGAENGQQGKGNEQGQQGSKSPSGKSQGNGKNQPSPSDSGQPTGQSDNNNRQSDPANLEYSKKATDLALDYLDRQREHPDPELLKKLNWTKEEMNAFADRWRRAKEEAMKDPRKEHELEDALKSLGLSPQTSRTRKVDTGDDRLRGLQESGTRVRPPESLREQIEAYRRGQSKK